MVDIINIILIIILIVGVPVGLLYAMYFETPDSLIKKQKKYDERKKY